MQLLVANTALVASVYNVYKYRNIEKWETRRYDKANS